MNKSNSSTVDVKKILRILKSLAKETNIEIIHLSIQSLIDELKGA